MATIPGIDFNSILNGIQYVLIALLLGGVVFAGIYYFAKRRRYTFKVEIYDQDSNGKPYRTKDLGGTFKDKKTGETLFWLMKAKWGGDPNPPFISDVDNRGRLKKIVTIQKIGKDSYRYIDIKMGEKPSFTIGPEDVNNYHHQAQKIRIMYNKEGMLSKMLPIIAAVIACIVIMVIAVSFLNKMEIMKEVAEKFDSVSSRMAYITELQYNITVRTQNPDMPIIKPSGG